MIQRIQTIFLIFAGLAFGSVIILNASFAQETYTWLSPVIIGLCGLAGLGALVAIFFYGDRKKQLQFTSLVQYLGLVAMLVVFAGLYFAGSIAEIPENLAAIAVAVLPVLGYILVRLATTRIKKDIELVRSMDRLR